MLAGIIFVTFLGALILSYKIGSINGYRKGYEECDAINMKDFGHYVKDKNKGKEDAKS
jgi:hypothetical protein